VTRRQRGPLGLLSAWDVGVPVQAYPKSNQVREIAARVAQQIAMIDHMTTGEATPTSTVMVR